MDGVDSGQLGCAVLLEQSANFSGVPLSGLVREDGSDLFQRRSGFSFGLLRQGFRLFRMSIYAFCLRFRRCQGICYSLQALGQVLEFLDNRDKTIGYSTGILDDIQKQLDFAHSVFLLPWFDSAG